MITRKIIQQYSSTPNARVIILDTINNKIVIGKKVKDYLNTCMYEFEEQRKMHEEDYITFKLNSHQFGCADHVVKIKNKVFVTITQLYNIEKF